MHSILSEAAPTCGFPPHSRNSTEDLKFARVHLSDLKVTTSSALITLIPPRGEDRTIPFELTAEAALPSSHFRQFSVNRRCEN